MEMMIAMRDCLFWWIGCWALLSGLDAGIAFVCWKLYRRGKNADGTAA